MTAFERLASEHLDSILQIERETSPHPWTRDHFEREIGFERARFFILKEGETVLAYGGIWLLGEEAQITNVAVAKRAQCKGLGRRMMEHLESVAREGGARVMTLEVRQSNAHAIRLYERNGYQRTGQREGIYPPHGETAVLMEKPL